MTVEVFHLIVEPYAREVLPTANMHLKIIWGDDDAAELVADMLRDPERAKSQGLYYEKVADVAGDDLDMAFQLTNTINKPWVHNQGVVCAVKKRMRSTSVGDVMAVGGRLFFVARSGFDEIKIAPKMREGASAMPRGWFGI